MLQCKDVKNQGGHEKKTQSKLGHLDQLAITPSLQMGTPPKDNLLALLGPFKEYFLEVEMMMDQSGRRRGVY